MPNLDKEQLIMRALLIASGLGLIGLLTTGCGGADPGDEASTASLNSLADIEQGRLAPAANLEADTLRPDEGRGAGQGGDKFERIVENPFLSVANNPLSTFSIDVDTAAYSKTRMYLIERGAMPPPDAVRIEEMVNYFSYDYAGPTDEHPFAARVEVAQCPWKAEHRLARIGIKGRDIKLENRPPSNLVLLVDVSGSMRSDNKLPLLKRGLQMLVEQLDERDYITIVAYAGQVATVLEPTPGDQKAVIMAALGSLQAGGSTAGGAGLEVAYQAAERNRIDGGINRVILCTDGDFNVGKTSSGELVRQVEEQAAKNIFMSVLAFGMGNHNDAMLEQISNNGNGNYAFIDTDFEARKVLVEQLSGTLIAIAKDVKIQIEFNPAQVAAYRLIGYENRMLAAEDFNDDKKDAGEIGAGHRVTALYEIVPVGVASEQTISQVDPLKYQQQAELSTAAGSNELLTVKLRYKLPESDVSTLVSFPVSDADKSFGEASTDFQFASAVASFGMLLRNSQFKGDATYEGVLEIAESALGADRDGYRGEFLTIVRRAQNLSH